MLERFQKIAERWFLVEPALFAIYCTHQFVVNAEISTPMRAGKGRIEFNPQLLDGAKDAAIEELLRVEFIRIFLKHPYDRQPENCSKLACALGSDCTIDTFYHDKLKFSELYSPEAFHLEKLQNFEFYAVKINKMLPEMSGKQNDSGDSDSSESNPEQSDSAKSDGSRGSSDNTQAKQGESAKTKKQLGFSDKQIGQMLDKTELWEEDEMRSAEINTLIEKTTSWGSIPGKLVEVIKASPKAKVDYRKVLQGFRASVISSKRALTRMRPNRRTGFQNLGSVYKFRTSLLVATDVSGSITSLELAHFYTIVNKFFKYGIETIDVLQFDCAVRPVISFAKASSTVEVHGRGGTSFQCVVDYVAEHPGYDGLIIMTDGYAAKPVLPPNFRTKILWILTDDIAYERGIKWMPDYGRVCKIEL